MSAADFLVIGGGIAGLSAAARLVRHGRVIVIEGEEALGFHSSGRSVSFSHFGIGNQSVRGLTAYSQAFFEDPPEGFSQAPLCHQMATLYFADEEALPRLDALRDAMTRFTDEIGVVDADGISQLCPAVRTGPGAAVRGLIDPSGLKLDTDAFLQACARATRQGGGEILTGRRIIEVSPTGAGWQVRTENGETHAAPVLINAAGAWADRIAALAGVAPLGLQPMRRTIIAIDPGVDASAWPFTHSIRADFYMIPEAGQILVSPADEVADDPCDAQPEDYDIALAADRLEHYTNLSVQRIAHRWAGLRTFTKDRVPTSGFAPDAPGFFWLAGQGGYGFQTSPAMAEAAESLLTGTSWPERLARLGVTAATVGPERLRNRAPADMLLQTSKEAPGA